MASQGYYDWVRAGRPYMLIRPAKALQAALRGHGLTVFDYPDDGHLEAATPEDHTPFSVTGWPGPNRRWHARALDVMPRADTAAARAENAAIARQLIRDRDAGVPGVMWIKYINWTAEDGTCQQERWMNAAAPLQRTTRSSGDDGHVHVSGRSDADDDARADGYDPIARMTGGGDDVDQNEILQFGPKAGGATVGDALSRGWKNTEDLADGNTVAHRALVAQLAKLQAAAVADQARDDALLAAVQAIAGGTATGGPLELAPVLAAVAAVRADTLAAVQQLQQQLADERARGGQLAAALAAAGASLQAADDEVAL